MRYALVNDNRVEAQPKFKGLCCCCSKPVIAKCGTRKIWHWAHKSKVDCDNWWEPETEWHRTWKNNYPSEWQEVSLFDERTGEKHIADVRTIDNLVIEFQHSHIEPQERASREQFYKNMVWIVDGTRLKRDYPRFLKGRMNTFHNPIFYKTDNPKIFEVDLLDWCFPVDWLKSSVPVIFDFFGDGTLDDDEMRKPLYCLFPQVGTLARVAEISVKAFIISTSNGEWTSRVHSFINEFREQDEIEKKEREQLNAQSSKKQTYSFGGTYRQFKSRVYLTNKPRRRRRF